MLFFLCWPILRKNVFSDVMTWCVSMNFLWLVLLYLLKLLMFWLFMAVMGLVIVCLFFLCYFDMLFVPGISMMMDLLQEIQFCLTNALFIVFFNASMSYNEIVWMIIDYFIWFSMIGWLDFEGKLFLFWALFLILR